MYYINLIYSFCCETILSETTSFKNGLFRIKESLIAGIIIAVLTGIYAVILISGKKKSSGCGGCGSCTCGKNETPVDDHNKDNIEE